MDSHVDWRPMGTRWARFARGWSAAGFATFVAALSHFLAGGQRPTAFAILVCLGLSGAVCVALAGRRLSVVRLALSVGLSQALFHVAFSSLGAPVIAAPTAHHAIAVVAAGEGASAHHDGWMWLAHALAALATVVALRFGESAFWGLLRTARLLVSLLVQPPRIGLSPLGRALIRAYVDRVVPLRFLSELSSVTSRRGPPHFA